MATQTKFVSELKGAVAASLQGLINVISPLLLFVSFLGPQAMAAGFWATVVTATVIHLVALLFKGQAAVMPSARTASLVAYIGLIVQLCLATGAPTAGVVNLSTQQLMLGLAAGSLMFLLASGLVLLSGVLKLGNVFKMIPTPVTSGISTGIALVLIALAIQKIVPQGAMAALIAGAMISVYAVWPYLTARVRALGAVPAVIVAPLTGIAIAFYLQPVALAPGTSIRPDWQPNWVSVMMWPSLSGQDFVRLATIGLPGAVTLALVMILETFTAAAVMETRFGARYNANRELFVLGGANSISALLGGVPSSGSPVRSVSSWLDGGRGPLASALCLVMTGALLLTLGPWLIALPAGVVAGLFFMQAMVMADPAFMRRLRNMVSSRQWGVSGTQDLGFWITFAITLVAFFGNLIWACGIGVALSCLAVLRRVSGNLTAQWGYLDQHHSRRVRSADETQNLARTFHRAGVLKLNGHLFFGNSSRLMQLADDLHPEATVVVIDVSQVHDVDPSGVDAVSWLVKALTDRRLKVVLAGLQKTRATHLRLRLQSAIDVKFCIDLDRGIEVCEDLVLMNSTVMTGGLLSRPLPANNLLQDLLPDELDAVLALGQHRTVAKGEVLFCKDALADGIWLLESGGVSILTGQGDASTRLATFGPGQFVGEMGFIDGKTRSATAWADSPVQALLLDNEAISALLEQQPLAALKITRNIARELSQRVRLSSALLADLAGDTGPNSLK